MIIDDDKCFECGAPATEWHHVIPESLGGTKTLPLCGCCHDRVHGWGNKRRDHHVELTIEGLRKAKERGVVLGNRTNLAEAQQLARDAAIVRANNFALEMESTLTSLIEQGLTLKQMVASLNGAGIPTDRNGQWHTTTVRNMLARIKRLQDASSSSTQIEQSNDLLVHS